MPAPAHVLEATLNKFIAGWKAWNVEEIIATWSPDCTHKPLPFSMGHPLRSLQDIKVVLPILMDVVQNYKLVIHKTVLDVARSKAAVYAVSRADTPFGEWTNEYAVFISFDESGDQVVKIEEMMDSAFMNEFHPKFVAHMQEVMAKGQVENRPVENKQGANDGEA